MHSSVLITCPVKVKRSQRTLSMRAAATEAEMNPSSQAGNISYTEQYFMAGSTQALLLSFPFHHHTDGKMAAVLLSTVSAGN